MTDFPAMLQALDEHHVEYIVVGGAAATAHGAARLTLDLDIVYRRTQQNISRLVASLAPHQPYLRGAPPGLPFRWDAETVQRGPANALVGHTVEEARSRVCSLFVRVTSLAKQQFRSFDEIS